MIDHLGTFLLHYLVVAVAACVLPLKWLVVRIWKDAEAEAVALLSVPEDLCYVTLGLVLGDIVNGSGAFRRHFQFSSHVSVDLTLTVAIGMAVPVVLHRLNQLCTREFRYWRAGHSAAGSRIGSDSQPMLPITDAHSSVVMLTILHLFSFALLYAFQMTFVLFWIHWVGKVVAVS